MSNQFEQGHGPSQEVCHVPGPPSRLQPRHLRAVARVRCSQNVTRRPRGDGLRRIDQPARVQSCILPNSAADHLRRVASGVLGVRHGRATGNCKDCVRGDDPPPWRLRPRGG